jgi:hypothetical protein
MSDEPHDFDPIPADGLLLALCEVARSVEGFELGITVTVPGATVTGVMVGPKAWLQILGASGEGSANEFLRGIAARMVEILDEGGDDVDTQFLHLREAQYVSGGTFTPTNTALLWRGRLAAVSGFSLGTVTPTARASA